MFPQLTQGSVTRTMISEFRGYNANYICNEDEFSEMRNMTGEYYPVMSPRDRRGLVVQLTNPQGIISKDALAYVDGTDLVYGEYRINMRLSENANDCPKQLISMGAYLIVFPDKKYLNTANIMDYGDIEAHFKSQDGVTITYSMCNSEAAKYKDVYISDVAPSEPVNGQYWLDTTTDTHALKVWSETASMWVSVATTYIRIDCEGIGVQFEKGDGVKISGSAIPELNNTMVIQAVEDDYIVVIGVLDNVKTQTTQISVARELPVMEYVTEANNRLWGCHYGLKDGETVNEIYACKLGDFRNWNCFAGISTDSYAVTVGTDGEFTGAITHLGYPLFFKENCIHKIYRNTPSTYQVTTTQCRGVQKGSYRSLAIVNEILYYKSSTDICAYDGSLPVSISKALGKEMYSEAVAGAYKGKYYLSAKNSKNEYELLVYDVNYGMWHKEDNMKVLGFAMHEHLLYFINANGKNIISICGTTEEDFQWMATTGVIGYEYPDRKYISRFNIRIQIEEGSKIEVLTEYDTNGLWISQGIIEGTGIKTFTLPVIPVRCDHMRIRFEGIGQCKIFSITKILEQGSDM